MPELAQRIDEDSVGIDHSDAFDYRLPDRRTVDFLRREYVVLAVFGKHRRVGTEIEKLDPREVQPQRRRVVPDVPLRLFQMDEQAVLVVRCPGSEIMEPENRLPRPGFATDEITSCGDEASTDHGV